MKEIKTFKQLIKALATIESEADITRICDDIDKAFHAGKITWDDRENLYTLAGFIDKNF